MDVTIRVSEADFVMRVPEADRIGGVLVDTGLFYEQEMLSDLDLLLSPGDVVLDVGANIGNHSVYFAGVSGCIVHAFEPNPQALQYLEHNIEANGLSGRVKVHAVALGARVGKAELVGTMAGNLGATRFRSDEGGAIEMLTIDSLRLAERIRLIKVDVEGMDLDVVKGAVETLKGNLPYLILECQDMADFSRASSWLEEFGYAALSCYNATDTYLFVHVESHVKEASFVRMLCRQVLRSQILGRSMKSSIKKIWRHIGNEK